MTNQPLTYKMLLDEQSRQAERGEINAQTAANRATALRALLNANHISESDVVGSEMRGGYPQSIERLVHSHQSEGRSGRSISNTRSALEPWRKAVIAYDELCAIANEQPIPFQTEVQRILNKRPVRRVARHTGIPHEMLRGWTLGKKPRPSNVKHVRRLEWFFGLERDSLVTLAGLPTEMGRAAPKNDAQPISYRKTLGPRIVDTYWLKPTVNSPLRQQWTDLLSYKVDLAPELERSEAGRWSFAPIPVVQPTDDTWWAFYKGVEVPTARVNWAKVAGFLGWLARAKEKGGQEFSEEKLQTLAWFVVPGLLKSYCEWVKDRAGGRYNNSITEFLGMVTWMTRADDGYLTQKPELQATLPEEWRTISWQELCARQYSMCNKLKRSLRSQIRPSRNPFEPMQNILNLHSPLDAIVDMVQRMRLDRPIGSPTLEAIWARDIFLIKLLSTIPLRVRNIATLCYSPEYVDGRKPDDRPALYRRSDSSWWISVPKHLLKNRRGAAVQDYDAPLHGSIIIDLERYLFRHREILLRGQTELVFLFKSCGEKNRKEDFIAPYSPEGGAKHKPSMYISRRVHYLTRKYLLCSDGVGAHSFRHLIATAILKSEDGTIKTAALVLNDRESTVEKHYAWLRSGDGIKRMGELLGETLNRM